jgi:hypothetical protein
VLMVRAGLVSREGLHTSYILHPERGVDADQKQAGERQDSREVCGMHDCVSYRASDHRRFGGSYRSEYRRVFLYITDSIGIA